MCVGVFRSFQTLVRKELFGELQVSFLKTLSWSGLGHRNLSCEQTLVANLIFAGSNLENCACYGERSVWGVKRAR